MLTALKHIHPSIRSVFELPGRGNGIFNEVFESPESVRTTYQPIIQFFDSLSTRRIEEFEAYAKANFFNQGITFRVYSDDVNGTERIFPFDIFPRIIAASEWGEIEAGIKQRYRALNLFLEDIYNEKRILKDGVVPYDLIFSSKFFCKQMIGFKPPGGIYTHIAGCDLIRHNDGNYYVLEDNLRSPSGVSYVMSNRATAKKIIPNLLLNYDVVPVNEYPQQLLNMLLSVSPEVHETPNCVLLTPGMFNSAYYEHTFLASQMGIPLVEGRDLFVDRNFVYMKTINGPERVDVIYRRIDDEFLDPMVYNKDSLLGVPGVMSAYREGNVNIVNATGTGIADDKAIYCYVPDIIKYYLGEYPILNNVKTYLCGKEDDLVYVLEHMEELVVKPVDESGGYGVMIGNCASREQLNAYMNMIKACPRKYIAQPIMSLSVHPTYMDDEKQFASRHIDLRIFSLFGKDSSYVCPGGLTRVALRKGNLIVNSSQGGGSKDTWVVNNY